MEVFGTKAEFIEWLNDNSISTNEFMNFSRKQQQAWVKDFNNK